MSPRLRTSFVLSLVVGLAGCGDGGYRVRLTFAEPVEPASVRFVELLVLAGCPSPADVASGEPPTGTILAGVGLAQSDAASLPAVGRLDPGAYGLYARGFDASCAAIAAGCTEIAVERGGEGTLEVVLGATAVVDACADDGVCVDGECMEPAPDGGTDGGDGDLDACASHPCELPDQFYCVDMPGDAPNTRDGRTCVPITHCTTEQYEVTPPTSTSDRVCGDCFPPCGDGEYEQTACAHGDTPQNRVCAQCHAACAFDNCTGPSEGECTNCNSTQYWDGDSCQPLTSCGTGYYQSDPPSPTSNRTCTPCAAPCNSSTQYESVSCADGNAPYNRICLSLDVCNPGEYASTPPTATTDRICSSCTSCTTGQFQTTACADGNGTQNRTCAPCTSCTAGQYQTTACADGNGTQNRTCSACTDIMNCATTETCTSASNSQCTMCASGYAVQDGTADTCVPNMGTCTLPSAKDGSARQGGIGPGSSGTDGEMNTSQSSASGYHYAYVAFDLGGACQEGGAIPAGASVVSATLRLRLTTDCTCGSDSHQLNRITEAWTEASVGMGTQPAATGTSASFTAPSVNGTVAITGATLASDVEGFLDGTFTNHGWRIRQSSTTGGNEDAPYRWATRESSFDPSLEIVWMLD